jgi:uncharacterized protein
MRFAQTQPFAVPVLLGALDLHQRGVMKIEICGELEPLFAEHLRKAWLPRAVWTRSLGDGEVIVCEGQKCLLPLRSVAEWEKRSL